MNRFPLLVLAILLVAGCSAPEEPVATLNATNESVNETVPTALPDNRSGEFAAFKETNVTDSGAHDHDQWKGQTRIEIIRTRAMLEAVRVGEGVYAVVRPPEGVEHLVFEGTGAVEVMLADPQRHACVTAIVVDGEPPCTPGAPDPGTAGSMTLQFLHGASEPDAWEDAGPVGFGAPTVIEIEDPRWTDMPHSTASLWVFRVVSASTQDLFLSFDLVVTAVRAEGEIPEWPGHPDFYAETTSRVVLEATAETEEFVDASWCCAVGPEKLVSYGTKTLWVFVNITSYQGPLDPVNWFLYHHNASGRVWNVTDPEVGDHGFAKKELVWKLAVDDNAMDTPYATMSRWEFALRGAASTPTGQSCIGGCAAYTVAYTISVVASSEPVEDYDPTFGWLPR